MSELNSTKESINATVYIEMMIKHYIHNKNTEFLRFTENGILIRSLGGIYHISIDKVCGD